MAELRGNRVIQAGQRKAQALQKQLAEPFQLASSEEDIRQRKTVRVQSRLDGKV